MATPAADVLIRVHWHWLSLFYCPIALAVFSYWCFSILPPSAHQFYVANTLTFLGENVADCFGFGNR